MSDGSYVGKDGRRYRWWNVGGEIFHQAERGCWMGAPVHPEDFDKAIAALQELQEEEESCRGNQENRLLAAACIQLREMAKEEGVACGPCDGCRLLPFYKTEHDELQEEEEWVFLGPGWENYRVKRDGSDMEYQNKFVGTWHQYAGNIRKSEYALGVEHAYNKGREVAKAEKDEKAQALAEWLLAEPASGELCPNDPRIVELDAQEFREMQALAREVQAAKELK